MPSYAIRYSDRAATQKRNLPAAHRASLEVLEKRLTSDPYGFGAKSNKDNSWSAFFTGGFINYVVSNNHLMINVINVASS
ncbi:hypothetical protein ACFVIM_05550 [Streptomyces sp. NPDC057638]|uniref:hypothetical protein n=1 Tax=Streptomyces sp. NPDC057638 TaxID=3346190 RepID=UPI0036CEEB63